MLKGVVFLAAFFVALAVSVPAFAQERGEGQEAMLRVVDLSPDAPEVDVYLDDKPVEALTGVSFKTVSSYVPLPAGTRNVKVYPAGASAPPLLEARVDLSGGASYTLGIVGGVEDGSLAAKLYEDDNSLPARGKTKVRVIQAVPDLGPATVRVKGAEGDSFTIPGFSNLPGFSNASNYAELPAGTYTLRVGGKVRAAGVDEVDLSVPGIVFSAGEVYTVFVVGRIADWSIGPAFTVDTRGGPPLLSTGGPSAPAAEPSDNSAPNAATPSGQEPAYEGANVSTASDPLEPDYRQPPSRGEPFVPTPVEPGPDYQSPYREEPVAEEPFTVTPVEPEPDYQQFPDREEPFVTTPVEPESDYQQPTGELTNEIANLGEEGYLDDGQLDKHEEERLERQVEKQEEHLEKQLDKQEDKADP